MIWISSNIAVDIEFLQWISNFLTVYNGTINKYCSIGAKSSKDYFMPSKFHLFPCIVTDEFLATDIPLCIDRSRGITGNNVTILATGCLVNSDTEH